MIATFAPHGDTSQTILQPAVGNALTVNLPNGGPRVVLLVSDRDKAKVVRHLDKVITVTDLMTGFRHKLIGDDCGAGCRCAVTFA